MTTAQIINAPAQFHLVLAVHDDQEITFTLEFEDGKRRIVTAEVWSFDKGGRNGYHNGHCFLTGIIQGDQPLFSGSDSRWAVFGAEYNQRTRTGKMYLGIELKSPSWVVP